MSNKEDRVYRLCLLADGDIWVGLAASEDAQPDVKIEGVVEIRVGSSLAKIMDALMAQDGGGSTFSDEFICLLHGLAEAGSLHYQRGWRPDCKFAKRVA